VNEAMLSEPRSLVMHNSRHHTENPHMHAQPATQNAALLKDVQDDAYVDIPSHLRLGISATGFFKFCKEELNMARSNLPREGLMSDPMVMQIKKSWAGADVVRARSYLDQDRWISEAYPGVLTGYDVCACIRLWLFQENAEEESVCEVLKERGYTDGEGHPAVGRAGLFLSHTQAEHPAKTCEFLANAQGRLYSTDVEASSRVIWLDYSSLRQCRSDFKIPTTISLIRDIGLTMVSLDPERAYLQRSFCILESYATVATEGQLFVQDDRSHTPARCWCIACVCCCNCRVREQCCVHTSVEVDSVAAQCRRPSDKAVIDGYIASDVGFTLLNERMSREMGRGVRDTNIKYCLMGCPLTCPFYYACVWTVNSLAIHYRASEWVPGFLQL
jgi:hypothetical protein